MVTPIPPPSFSTILMQIAQNPVLLFLILAPLALILLDVLTGIADAVKQKQFDLAHITDFLGNDALQYTVSLFFVAFTWLLSGMVSATTLAATLGMGSMVLSIGSSIVRNTQSIFGANSPLEKQIEVGVQELERLAGTQPVPSSIDTNETLPLAAVVRTNTPAPTSYEPTQMMPSVQRAQLQQNMQTVPMPAVSGGLAYTSPPKVYVQSNAASPTFSNQPDPLRIAKQEAS